MSWAGRTVLCGVRTPYCVQAQQVVNERLQKGCLLPPALSFPICQLGTVVLVTSQGSVGDMVLGWGQTVKLDDRCGQPSSSVMEHHVLSSTASAWLPL
jgi:hypothetical protein